jgi:hypothetical protein
MTFRKFCVFSALISILFTVLSETISIVAGETESIVFAGLLGECSIYLLLPGIAGWKYSFRRGTLIGVLLGLVDGIIVLIKDSFIGPLLPTYNGFSFGLWLFAAIGVLAISSILGLIGAGIGSLARRRAAA